VHRRASRRLSSAALTPERRYGATLGCLVFRAFRNRPLSDVTAGFFGFDFFFLVPPIQLGAFAKSMSVAARNE
jgi:hypothetical protein